MQSLCGSLERTQQFSGQCFCKLSMHQPQELEVLRSNHQLDLGQQTEHDSEIVNKHLYFLSIRPSGFIIFTLTNNRSSYISHNSINLFTNHVSTITAAHGSQVSRPATGLVNTVYVTTILYICQQWSPSFLKLSQSKHFKNVYSTYWYIFRNLLHVYYSNIFSYKIFINIVKKDELKKYKFCCSYYIL